jgi:SAM-dependent methyltransferase
MDERIGSHASRLAKEVDWYEREFKANHILNRWPFYSKQRETTAYEVAHRSLSRVAKTYFPAVNKVLIAPCGEWGDLPFLRAEWSDAEYVGVDISPNCLKNAPVEAHVGDIRGPMPFSDHSFDLAVATLFFHHVADEGFADYLREFKRVLRPGGALITMEQSMFHPLFLVTRPLKRFVGNITGQVDHEHPISLRALAAACRARGFSRTRTFACSFGHQRVPVPIRATMNTILTPLKGVPVIKHLGWQVGLIAWK